PVRHVPLFPARAGRNAATAPPALRNRHATAMHRACPAYAPAPPGYWHRIGESGPAPARAGFQNPAVCRPAAARLPHTAGTRERDAIPVRPATYAGDPAP